MSVAIQGIAFEFEKVFKSDGQLWYAKPRCFGSPSDVDLLIGHEGKSYANTNDRLNIHSGDEALIFRAYIMDEWFDKEMSDVKDELETYLAVSAGFTVTKTAMIDCDGIPVNVILEATLHEISLLDHPPVIDATYARVVSEDKCGSLETDYDMIRTVGRFVGLHRKIMAGDNNGEINYAHSPTAYERAADKFQRQLAKLQ